MLTKTKMLGLVLATAMVSTSPMLVYADNGGGDKDSWHQGGEEHHGPMDHMMAKILNLSDDQVKQLKDDHQKQKEAMKALFEQIKSNREALNVEIVKSTLDMNKINDLQIQLKALQSQMADNHLNALLEIKKIMTPEQFAGFMALKKEREMKKHMMGHDKFGHKDGFDKDRDDHEGHWADKAQDSDD